MAAGSSSCSPILLLLLPFLASAGAGTGEASTLSTSAPAPAPAPALGQVCGRLGSYYVTPSLCASVLCAARDAPAARSCLQLYAGAVPTLRWAARAVGAGRYRGARLVLQAARYVAAGCEGIAGDAAAALPRENDGFGDMAFVAHAVVASMSTG